MIQADFLLKHHQAFSILFGFLLDCLFGDPHFFPHIVRFMGKEISFLEKLLLNKKNTPFIQRFKGFFLVLIVIFTAFIVPQGIFFLAKKISGFFCLGLESFFCYQCIAARSLFSESMKVASELNHGSLDSARKALSMIVGRDTNVLDKKGVAKAAVETVAENTNDGVIAPLFYMILFGASGAIIYKAINTMDSMIAYKNEKYIHFGFFAAKLDDLANFLPARLSAVLMILASACLSLLPLKAKIHFLNAIKIFSRDRYKHASPNSAQTESVCAGALGVRLAGDAIYEGILEKKEFIGDELREIESKDIFLANLLMYLTTILLLAGSLTVKIMLRYTFL